MYIIYGLCRWKDNNYISLQQLSIASVCNNEKLVYFFRIFHRYLFKIAFIRNFYISNKFYTDWNNLSIKEHFIEMSTLLPPHQCNQIRDLQIKKICKCHNATNLNERKMSRKNNIFASKAQSLLQIKTNVEQNAFRHFNFEY